MASDEAQQQRNPNDHGYCPHCGADLDGDLIWETGLKMKGSEAGADEYAEAYGATRTTGHWGRAMGIYDREKDCTVAWKCPDCGEEWERPAEEIEALRDKTWD